MVLFFWLAGAIDNTVIMQLYMGLTYVAGVKPGVHSALNSTRAYDNVRSTYIIRVLLPRVRAKVRMSGKNVWPKANA